MEVVTTISALRERLGLQRREGRSIGFVPTMGYLHKGHMTLVERSKALADVTVVSIFVNPLQFAPTEDLARYPRDLNGTARFLRRAAAISSSRPRWRRCTPARWRPWWT